MGVAYGPLLVERLQRRRPKTGGRTAAPTAMGLPQGTVSILAATMPGVVPGRKNGTVPFCAPEPSTICRETIDTAEKVVIIRISASSLFRPRRFALPRAAGFLHWGLDDARPHVADQ